MKAPIPSLLRTVGLWGVVFAVPQLLAQGGGITYDLLPGSFLLNDCPICDRVSIEEPLAGSFDLEPLPAGPGYRLTGIDLHTTGATPYAVSGQGSYTVVYEKTTTQEMTLDLEINGEAGIHLGSGSQEVLWPWPAIDGSVVETTDSQTRVYHLRLLAIPRASETMAYELLPGSTFIDDCLPCARPTIPLPIAGSFTLGTLGAGPLFQSWRVDGADFHTTDTDTIKVTGAGIYSQGGEVALLQEMLLEVTVNDVTTHVLLSSQGKVPLEAAFPRIEIDLVQLPPTNPFHTYSAHLVAAPLGQVAVFRRGDPNDDGLPDISDAVRILIWLFTGGQEPGCLDAADVDGSGGHDINDPVFLLNYLFLSGKVPPPPGPSCGPQGVSSPLSCLTYRSCSATASAR